MDWISVKNNVLNECHWLFKLQSRKSRKCGNDGHERVEADREEDDKNYGHPINSEADSNPRIQVCPTTGGCITQR